MSRFREPQHPDFQRLNASIDFDRRLWPQDIAQSRAHARMLAARGIIAAEDRDALLAGLDAVELELREGRFPFDADDEDIHMAIERRLTELVGPVGGQAAHRPLAQRPGRDRPGDVHARARRRGAGGDRGADGRRARPRGGAPRLAAARLHPPAARPARLPLPSPARLLLDARPRPRALRLRRARGRPAAARRGRARGGQLRHRPPPGRRGARLSRGRRRTRSTRSPGATSSSTTSPPPRPARRTSPGSAPSWCCGRARSSASASSPTPGRRAPRSCPRRRTPTRPSCCAARRRASSATSRPCTA